MESGSHVSLKELVSRIDLILCGVQSRKREGKVFDLISLYLPMLQHAHANDPTYNTSRFRWVLISLFASTLVYDRGENHVDAYDYGGQIWEIPKTPSTSGGHCFLRDWGLHVANSTAPIHILT